MKAFKYPKAKHRRGPDPGPYRDYRTYKPYLRDEFEARCVYCRLSDAMNRRDTFAVEHHLPKSVFGALTTEWTNLYYACAACNAAKGSFSPSGTWRHVHYVPTPCNDVMFDHLRYRGARVVPHSETGRFAEELLDLNEPESVRYRESYQVILDEAETRVAEFEHIVADADRASRTAEGARLAALQEGRRRAEAKLAEAKSHLGYIVGPYPP